MNKMQYAAFKSMTEIIDQIILMGDDLKVTNSYKNMKTAVELCKEYKQNFKSVSADWRPQQNPSQQRTFYAYNYNYRDREEK